MKKCCAVCDFLSEENKKQMRAAAAECGFEIAFYNDAEEADGKVGGCEVIYCSGPGLLGQMKDLKWCHSSDAGVGPFVRSGIFDDGRVLLTNSAGAYGLAISEHVIMVTLMLMRRMPEYLEITGRRGFEQGLGIRSIAGSNIVIIGTGDTGGTLRSDTKRSEPKVLLASAGADAETTLLMRSLAWTSSMRGWPAGFQSRPTSFCFVFREHRRARAF